MDHRDDDTICPCGMLMLRKFEAPHVMNTALPDGIRRFDKVREYRKLENAKRGAAKDEKAKLVAEQNKVLKKGGT